MAFKSKEKLAGSGGIVKDYSSVMPDLVVEVNSPSDSYTKIAGKVNDWLKAGVSMVWVIDPINRAVAVYNSSGRCVVLQENNMLDGGDILTGFKCRAGDIFII
ncbi:MAG: hypothetical protein BWY64_03942 [bacterium ADurb.Bin363]|nr:MAG: hypothetical protein BWY64_03942 [bacterium ADurb.Bin363]